MSTPNPHHAQGTTLAPGLSPVAAARPRRVSSLATLPTIVAVEARVWSRDPLSVFFGLGFPVLLMVGLSVINPAFGGAVTDMRPEATHLAGVSIAQHFMPAMLALTIASPAIQTLPTAFAVLREKQVLRRFSTTPMRPGSLLGAHLVINGAVVLLAAALVLIVGHWVFGLAPMADPGLVALGFALGLAATFAMGLLLAAVLQRVSVAGGVTTVVYFANIILSGVMSPGPLEGTMATVGMISPLGSAAQVMSQGWFDGGFPTVQVVVLAAWTLVATPLAIRIFRWR